MAQQIIQPGASANDGTGDTLRTGAAKINANFTELYGSISYSLPTATTTILGGVRVDGTSITINNSTISSHVPTASNTVLGGVKVDGSTITIDNNGVISSSTAYTLPVATASVLGGVKVDNSTITINEGVITYTLPTASNVELGGVKVDNSTITISNGFISVAPTSRTVITGTSSTLAAGEAGTFEITGHKSYVLFKIQVSGAAWVTLYTDAASRTADASRTETTDPLPGSGVLAEVITTGADTIIMSPGTIGFNNEASPTTSIPIKVVNKGGSSTAITVTLTVLKLES